MASKLLLVGLATDGPTNIVNRLTNETSFAKLYGDNFVERFSVSSSATGLVLRYDPWKTPNNSVDNRLEYLYLPYIDSSNTKLIRFGNIGGSGNHVVDMTYTPYLGEKDLLISGKRFAQAINDSVYVLRVGGTAASSLVDGWQFEAKYPGSRYNNLSITSNGTSIVISGMEPNYLARTFTFTSVEKLKRDIDTDFSFGACPLVCTIPGTAMIAAGTYYVTGGTDGTFSDEEFALAMDATIPTDVSHVVILAPATSSIMSTIETYLIQKENSPKMFFVQAPDFYEPTSTWVSNMVSYLPYRNNMVSLFLGTVETVFNATNLTRYSVEAGALAFMKAGSYNLTNRAVDAINFNPVLSETDLRLVKANGFIPLMRYIGNDVSTYEGINSAGASFLLSSKLAEISSIAYEYCSQFFGYSIQDGEQTDMARELANRLGIITFLTITQVNIYKTENSLYVRVEGFLPEEILNISFTIRAR